MKALKLNPGKSTKGHKTGTDILIVQTNITIVLIPKYTCGGLTLGSSNFEVQTVQFSYQYSNIVVSKSCVYDTCILVVCFLTVRPDYQILPKLRH